MSEAEAVAAWNTRSDYSTQKDNELRVEQREAKRTCKNNAPVYLDFLCSECGFVHYHSEANDTGEGNEWNYCPNCGAKIVDE